jgi:hypothetical protein
MNGNRMHSEYSKVRDIPLDRIDPTPLPTPPPLLNGMDDPERLDSLTRVRCDSARLLLIKEPRLPDHFVGEDCGLHFDDVTAIRLRLEEDGLIETGVEQMSRGEAEEQ